MKLNYIYSFYILKLLPIHYLTIIKKEIQLNISFSNIYLILFFLRYHSNCQYKILTDICAIDYPNKKNRFYILYNLLSYSFNHRIFVVTQFKDFQNISSIYKIYTNSNWLEREIWDMFGIFFTNHPDLRRILTDYGFEGYPLRKDFPLSGYFEIYYNEINQKIDYQPVSFVQEYRTFKYSNPWINNN